MMNRRICRKDSKELFSRKRADNISQRVLIAARTKDARGRSPTFPSPTLLPGALLPKVTRSINPVNPSSESMCSRKYGTRFRKE